ncbi:MAG TPA: DUF2934 domain-containing protein [Blastocatellia bacterium]|nr:DUF2934 domain-containing protein [Blastocatellia bacterium]
MTREKAEDLRERLLRDEQVQRLIRMRAYEIYKERGGRHGNPTEDWLRAESEVLAYVIEEETKRRSKEQGGAGEAVTPAMEDERAEGPRTLEAIHTPETSDRVSAPGAQTSEERAESQGILGTWSPAEPESAARAPELGRATDAAKEKKARTRPATKDSSAKKSASKAGGANKAASNKAAGGSKGKKKE